MYTCSMHPEVMQEKTGMCPACGMNLVETRDKKQETGNKHAGHSTQMFLRKFWVSFALTIPVVAYSGLLQELFSLEFPAFPGSDVIPLVFGSLVFFYGGWMFIQSAFRELKARSPGMMTLIALAISTAYAYSVFVFLRGAGIPLFWELTSLITVMLLGHWMEMRSVRGAQGALQELSKLLPDTAEVIRNGTTKAIPLSELREGDVVQIRPGARIPADGVVLEGSSEVDESLVTGESKPVPKIQESGVIGGTINGDGALRVRIALVGERTFLAGVMRLIAEAQASKSGLQLLSDRAAYWLTLIAIGGGTLTFLFWIIVKAPFDFAIERLVAVLVIACPHALGLAIPLVASISTSLAARNGFLVRKRSALESARSVDVVLFDKTGTLTKGEYGVVQADDNALLLAASVDAQSEHFVAKALVKEAQKRGLALLSVSDFARIPGKGVQGMVEGREVRVEGSESQGIETVVRVVENGKEIGAIALADVIREESREAVERLKSMGIQVAMITGDSGGVASWVAKELGIEEYFAKVLPEEKSEKVKLLQARGKKVAMVGDGINDAPALVQADLGIAIGAGANVAIESAGIILVRNDPRDAEKIIRLSRMTYRKMMQNLFWASGYNVVALPLAAGVLAGQGIFLQPALAALFMSLSTVIVAINAMLLKGTKL